MFVLTNVMTKKISLPCFREPVKHTSTGVREGGDKSKENGTQSQKKTDLHEYVLWQDFEWTA